MSQSIQEREIFLLDLEFINALASPQYLQRAHLPPQNVDKCMQLHDLHAGSSLLGSFLAAPGAYADFHEP